MNSPIQAFKPHFDALARLAYFKIVPGASSKWKLWLHNVYRSIVWIVVGIYNLQHVIRVIQYRHSTEEMANTMLVLLSTMNVLGKQLALNLRSKRIDGVICVIEGHLFSCKNIYHSETMKANALEMSRLLKLYHGCVITCGILWTIFPIVNKVMRDQVEFTGYFPFDPKEMPYFGIAVAFNSIAITFQAVAHGTLDCTIVSFYAQSRAQLQNLRYNLEHLVETVSTENNVNITKHGSRGYKDVEDPIFGRLLKRKFTRCIRHYQLILWYTKEIESIFNEAMVVQLFASAWVICVTVYRIVGLVSMSVEFVSMAIYLCCMLTQLFIYCYYGTQVTHESEFINQSLYCGEWTSLSPSFRRMMLIMMVRCGRVIAPMTAYIIPMSLETFIAVLRLSYSLFTFLERKRN